MTSSVFFAFSIAALFGLSTSLSHVAGTNHNAPRTVAFDHQMALENKWHNKPGAAVSSVSGVEHFLDLHEQRELELLLLTDVTEGTVKIHVEAEDGLVVLNSKTDWEFSAARSNTIALPVKLYGAIEGRHYVHIFVEHIDELGHTNYRALAQQVNVGYASLEQNHYRSAAEKQAPFVDLPAAETIY